MAEKNFSSLIKQIFKPLLGILILVFLILFGGLDPILLAKAFQNGLLWIGAATITYILLTALAGYRWYLLISRGNVKFPFARIFSLHMIGLFFVTVLPGGTGGDLAKGFYLFKDRPGNRAFALSSIFMDRIVGFYALLSWGMLGIAINWHTIVTQPVLMTNAIFFLVCFLICLGLGFLFFIPQGDKGINWLKLLNFPGHRILKGLLESFAQFRKFPFLLLLAYFLTLIIQGGLLLTFYFIGKSLIIPLTLGEHAGVVPLLMMINGIPLTPGGLGVGEMVAGTLYQTLNVSKGAEILALYHFCVLVCAFLGAPFYFKFKQTS